MLPRVSRTSYASTSYASNLARRSSSSSPGLPPGIGALVLEDGKTFLGKSIGAPVSVQGERSRVHGDFSSPPKETNRKCFNIRFSQARWCSPPAWWDTPRTCECSRSLSLSPLPSLTTPCSTDPSFYGQILAFAQPLIGNYGVSHRAIDKDGLFENIESREVWTSGVLMQSYTEDYSHWQAERSLGSWLKEAGVPGLSGIDTRALTKHLRTHGTMAGNIHFGSDQLQFMNPLLGSNVVPIVSRRVVREYGNGYVLSPFSLLNSKKSPENASNLLVHPN